MDGPGGWKSTQSSAVQSQLLSVGLAEKDEAAAVVAKAPIYTALAQAHLFCVYKPLISCCSGHGHPGPSQS